MSDLFRGYDHVLDQIGKTNALQPWRRAVAQYRILQCFEQLVEEIRKRPAGRGCPGATAK